MNRILPHPFLTGSLLLIWLLLNSFSPGHLVLGSIVALAAGKAFAPLVPGRVKLRKPQAILKLFFIVFYDIIRSNAAVAFLIMTNNRHGKRRSDFIEVPLRLRDPEPLAILAIIVTATPGTAWLEYHEDTGILLLHVFDFKEQQDWITLIQDRYERLLMEAFPT